MTEYNYEQIDIGDSLREIAARYPGTVMHMINTASNILDIANQVSSDYKQEIHQIQTQYGHAPLYRKPIPCIRIGENPLLPRSRIYWREATYVSKNRRTENWNDRKYSYKDIPSPRLGEYKKTHLKGAFSSPFPEYIECALKYEDKLLVLRRMLGEQKSAFRTLRKSLSGAITLAELHGLSADEVRTLAGGMTDNEKFDIDLPGTDQYE